MTADRLVTALTSEATAPIQEGELMLARHSYPVRKELLEAARVLNPADPMNAYVTQHSTVCTNALARAINNIR